MHQLRRIAVLVAALGAGLLGSRPALAWHTDEQRMTDGHAYTLGKKHFRVGLWTAEAGVLKRLDLSTWVFPWILQVKNLGAKYEFRATDRLSFGNRLHVFWWDLSKVKNDAPKLVLVNVPWEHTITYRFSDKWTASWQGVLTYTHAQGTLEKSQLDGAATISNLQFVHSVEYRLNEELAWFVRMRWLAYQWPLSASAKVVHQLDDYTTVTVVGTGRTQVFDVRNAWSIVPGVAWSRKNFNLRVGVGYGNINIGGVNMMLERKTAVPEFDLFWTW